ncbi:uncharacterized protein Dwil_GK27197 [Drosophila willistoni]|uniref:Uncharacterized protein n=1 Tax=Drosophila willistoni TaxID=7260 RepID=A0A0Q9WSW0_DROWI|nr:uncharacterized protein Dwil_GK27197 [Drosophila willistoni]
MKRQLNPFDSSSLSAADRRQQHSIWGVDPRAPPPPRPIPIPTRAANHNYDNVSGYVPGYFYQPVPRPTATPAPIEATTSSSHQSELVPSEARRRLEQQQEDEEQIVHIGGSRSLATNYKNYNRNFIQPQQQQPQALSQQEYIAKYLQHYANYVRKYPQRLRPIYNDDK